MNIELSIFQGLYGIAGTSGLLDASIIFSAKYLGIFLLAGFFALVFFEVGKTSIRMRWHWIAYGVLVLVLSRGLLVELIRFFYPRERPFSALGIEPLISHEANAGFPSGHTAFYFALALIVWRMHRTFGWVALAGAVAIGCARVIAGIHWPLDILGGMLVAGLGMVIADALMRHAKGG